jgi:nucleotide-binding universal stress UspA family protein
MAERIIIAIDGGPAGDAALEWVIHRSRAHAVTVRLTALVEPGSTGARQERAIAAATARLRAEAPQVPTTEYVRRGAAADSLVGDSTLGDLVVIGARPVNALISLLGSTLAQHLAGQTRCALIVVPEGWRPGARGVTVAWDSDGSSDRAVAFAAAEASLTGDDLSILHAWTPLPVLAFDAVGAATVVDEDLARQESTLHGVAQAVRRGHPHVEVTETFVPGPAGRAVRRAGADHGMLVLGSHARSRVGTVMFGSLGRDLLAAPPTVIAVVPTVAEPIHVLPEILEEELI